MTSFVDVEPDGTFLPEDKHTISDGGDPNVFGGVLHAVALTGADKPVVNITTTFRRLAKPFVPISSYVTRTDLYDIVTLEQGDAVISTSTLITSDKPISNVGDVDPLPHKQFREREWDWGWGSGSDLLAYMTGYFRRDRSMMWLKDHKMDLAAVATLCDFGTINLVPLVGQFGRTVMLTSHFTGVLPECSSQVTHQIRAQSQGCLITQLDQYTEDGRPVCLTTMTAKVRQLDTGWKGGTFS
jgi:hypothetical protein